MRIYRNRPYRALPALLAALSLAACDTAGAPRPGVVSTSRMGVVKSPGVVAAGVVQVEAGYSEAHRDTRTRRAFGETFVRLGIGHDTELRALLPSYMHTATPTATTEGGSDAAVAVKHRFRQPAGYLPGVALTLGTTLPTGAEAVSTGGAQPEGSVSAEWKLPHRLALVGTYGHRDAVLKGDRYGQNTLGVATRADLSRRAAAQLEYTQVSATRAGAVDVRQVRGTGALRLTPNLQLDGWAGCAAQKGVKTEHQFGVGFTHRW